MSLLAAHKIFGSLIHHGGCQLEHFLKLSTMYQMDGHTQFLSVQSDVFHRMFQNSICIENFLSVLTLACYT